MPRTELTFQTDGELMTMQATVLSVQAASSLADADKALFKQLSDDHHVVIINATVFHPQGGGQPSDVGSMASASGAKFEVHAVRMSAVTPDIALHFGVFVDGSAPFAADTTVTQYIDTEKRLLYSRYHTAGHVLGAAVKTVVEQHVPGFEETKASHFPDSAACEFQGSIEGKWKEGIQAQVDAFIAQDLPVEIDWWDESDFKANGLERLTPDRKAMGIPEGQKFRVARIVGAETYPCGGTHVPSTQLCGKTNVKKISRSKGTSRVSYDLP